MQASHFLWLAGDIKLNSTIISVFWWKTGPIELTHCSVRITYSTGEPLSWLAGNTELQSIILWLVTNWPIGLIHYNVRIPSSAGEPFSLACRQHQPQLNRYLLMMKECNRTAIHTLTEEQSVSPWVGWQYGGFALIFPGNFQESSPQ